jgi:hypothetical protein
MGPILLHALRKIGSLYGCPSLHACILAKLEIQNRGVALNHPGV